MTIAAIQTGETGGKNFVFVHRLAKVIGLAALGWEVPLSTRTEVLSRHALYILKFLAPNCERSLAICSACRAWEM